MNDLTPRQAEVLACIVRHWGETGCWPTLREVGAALGIRSPNGVAAHLKALAAKGAVVLSGSVKARSVAVPALVEAAGRAAAEFLARRAGA